jgi:hypothetical protein
MTIHQTLLRDALLAGPLAGLVAWGVGGVGFLPGALVAWAVAAINFALLQRLSTRFLRAAAEGEDATLPGIFLAGKSVVVMAAFVGLTQVFPAEAVAIGLGAPFVTLSLRGVFTAMSTPVDDLTELKPRTPAPALREGSPE